MGNPLDLLRLPPGIDSPDPVEGNPFPEEDVRHGFWNRATTEAEEEACRLNAEFMRSRPSAPDEALRFDVAYFIARYDIWAKRGVRVVLAREMIADWDQWLANYARAILVGFNAFSPPSAFLLKLRDGLIGKREHWKAAGRRNVELQKAHQVALDSRSASNVVEQRVEVLPALSESASRKLALQMKALLERNGLDGHYLDWMEECLAKMAAAPPSRFRPARAKNYWWWQWDHILLPPSKAFGRQRLQDLTLEYFPIWSSKSLQSEVYADWVRALLQRVMDELANAWKGRSEAIDDWYEKHSGPEIRKELLTWAKTLAAVARTEELKRLEAQRTGGELEPNETERSESDPAQSPESAHDVIPWSARLRTAREKASLSRPAAQKALRDKGIQITADAIKKHEEGAARPRKDVRKAYAVIYNTPESELFTD